MKKSCVIIQTHYLSTSLIERILTWERELTDADFYLLYNGVFDAPILKDIKVVNADKLNDKLYIK